MEENSYLADARKRANMSREKVCEKADGRMTIDHLRRLETSSIKIVCPEDIIILSEIYNDPSIPRYYCSQVCGIGKELNTQSEQFSQNVSNIILNIVASLNELCKKKDAIPRIFSDEKLDQTEEEEFDCILDEMKLLKLQIEAFQLWCIAHRSSETSR